MRDPENIRAIEALGVDLMGFIFWPKSSRYVGERPAYLPTKVKRVGVFVDDDIQNIKQKVEDFGLDIIQLHGQESPDYVRQLTSVCGDSIAIIKAFNIATAEDLKQTNAYNDIVDYFLFDTKAKMVGGNGTKFDWSILSAYHGNTPYILSGGIGPDDAEDIRMFHHPQCIGIDLNSRFELAPALKDTDALRIFLTHLSHNSHQTHQTMNKINKLFSENKNQKLLSLYFCAGAPTLESTGEVIKTLQRRGISMIEVGIPFSDPMADGPVIQDAATTALKNGMTLRKLFSQLKDIKDEVNIPLVLMGYLNPIMQYGIEAFCQSCVDSGVSGVIIPDLPFKDYQDTVKPIADKYDIRIIMLITPETSEERIRFIDDNTDGFIYMVSSAAITGAQKSFDDAKQEYFRRINAMNLRNPRMIGFGISNAQTLKAAQDNAAGAIIGSKFVTLLNETGNADKALDQLFDALKQ